VLRRHNKMPVEIFSNLSVAKSRIQAIFGEVRKFGNARVREFLDKT
jgi:hypothetical protein